MSRRREESLGPVRFLRFSSDLNNSDKESRVNSSVRSRLIIQLQPVLRRSFVASFQWISHSVLMSSKNGSAPCDPKIISPNDVTRRFAPRVPEISSIVSVETPHRRIDAPIFS